MSPLKHTYKLTTHVVDTVESDVQGHSQLHRKFKASPTLHDILSQERKIEIQQYFVNCSFMHYNI